MIRFTRAQVQPIGLDIGHDSIKMLQLERVGDSLSVMAAARQSLPPEVRTQPQQRMALAADLVKQMFRQGNFHGYGVVACLPRDILHVKNLRVPQMPVSELPAVVRYEAKNILPFDPVDAQLQFLPAGEVRQGTEIRQELIVMAARNEDISVFLESLQRCGATVEALDVEACALYRTIDRFIRRREDEQEVYVLVEVGQQRTQVVIGKGREISFIKVIELGAKHLHEAVSRKLGITVEEAQALRRRLTDPVEAPEASGRRDPVRQAAFDATRSVMEELGREISLCLRYYSVTFRGHRPTKLRLLGGEAGDPQLQSLLNAAMTIPVEVGRPLFSVDTSRIKPADRRGAMAEWATALGLGLKLVQGTFGARDGKPRDLLPTPSLVDGASAPAGSGAVLVDLPSAMKAVASEGTADPAAARSAQPEVARA
jgi:type IV pilus assembly protein PilM